MKICGVASVVLDHQRRQERGILSSAVPPHHLMIELLIEELRRAEAMRANQVSLLQISSGRKLERRVLDL